MWIFAFGWGMKWLYMFINCWIRVSFQVLQADLTLVPWSVFLIWHETTASYIVKLMRLPQVCRAIINTYVAAGECIKSMHDANWEKLFVSKNMLMCIHTFSQKIDYKQTWRMEKCWDHKLFWSRLLTNQENKICTISAKRNSELEYNPW